MNEAEQVQPAPLTVEPAPPAILPSQVTLPLLIAILTTALLTGLILIIQQIEFRPAWRFLFPIVFLSALEGIYTTRWLLDPERRQLNRSHYRAAELLVIAFLLRLLSWAVSGGFPDWEIWRGYFIQPRTFLDGTYFVYLLCAVLAWAKGSNLSGLFTRLYLSPGEQFYYSLPTRQKRERYDDRPITWERPEIFANLVRSWLNGGVWLALFAATTTVNVPVLAESRLRSLSRLGMPPEMLTALLIYFLLGLALVSHARLVMMQSRWLADDVQPQVKMSRTWHRATLFLLLAVGLAAAFLPIGSTFAITPLLELFATIGLFLFQLFFLVFGLVIMLFLSVFGLQAGSEEQLEAGGLPTLTPPPVPTLAPPNETVTLIIGALFWMVAGVVILFAIAFFLHDRGYSLSLQQLSVAWQKLVGWFKGFWQRTSASAEALQQAVRARLKGSGTEVTGTPAPWRFIRLNALSPREQIRYFYLSTIRRAADRGVPRSQSETPLEYAQDLKTEWPEAETEIEQLTGAFLEARYNRRPIEGDDVKPVKKVWKEVKATLRRRRKPQD